MSFRVLKLFAVMLPCMIIGGFEYIRHEFLLAYLSMEAGNFYITLITLVLSYLFATWMFRSIEQTNLKLSQEEARRAVYEERERLAGELHDNLAQTLFFLNVKLKQGHLEDAKAAVSEIDNSLRQAIFNLRTPPEAGSAFIIRLNKWLQDWTAITGIELTQEINIPEQAFNSYEEVQLFGIIQEAFTNIRKHSKAEHASIKLHMTEEGWGLHITDDGCGLDSNQGTSKQYGIDLMQKRAHELGASWELQTQSEGYGVQLCVIAKRRKSK
ncbi:Sensor histidine kinase LiaS [compost metagenome]